MKIRTEWWRTTGGPARFFYVVPSVLALLALALTPISARAENSGKVVYHDGPASLESKGPEETGTSEGPTKSPAKNHTDHKHPASTQPASGAESTETVAEPEAESHSPEHHHAGASPSGRGGNHPPGGGEGPSKSGSPSAVDSAHKLVRNVSPGPQGPATGKSGISDAGSGGSSTLLPVLIAMAVLAAASIGVVLYRQRRGDSGPDGYAG
jgi:hypothetical protein